MKPKHRNRRFLMVFAYTGFAIIGTSLLLKALGDNKQLFKNPSDVVTASYIQGENDIRIGGLVVEGSVVKPDALHTNFSVVNFTNHDEMTPELKVLYEGVLPDLFRDGQGVVMTGKISQDGVFMANNVLAKHDENYMPKMPDS